MVKIVMLSFRDRFPFCTLSNWMEGVHIMPPPPPPYPISAPVTGRDKFFLVAQEHLNKKILFLSRQSDFLTAFFAASRYIYFKQL